MNYTIGPEIPDLVFDVLKRSQRGRREEHWHCREQVAAAGVAWPLAGAGWAAGAAGQFAGAGSPGQTAEGAQVFGLKNGQHPERGLGVPG